MSDQVSRVMMLLRDEIGTGRLVPGGRLVEVQLSERLGVSRTPVRTALRLLAAEGLLEASGARGFRVKAVDERRVRSAILLRGLIEGFAAREVALQGLTRAMDLDLQLCLDEGDRILGAEAVLEEQALEFIHMNTRFHATILSACGSDLVATMLELCSNVPFAGTKYLAYDRSEPSRELLRFQISHAQHHDIVGAIRERDTGRAESLMRGHAHNALNYVGLIHQENRPPQIAIVP